MTKIVIDVQTPVGTLDVWRHAVGQGGINWQPLPERVIEGARKLRLRWIRVFIQEFFAIYPEHGRFDWSRLDPYMDALARTGAKVVAALTIKPRPLYPEIGHAVWRPNDVHAWAHVVQQLVRRYSVERPLVTHWEIGNEPDIGEAGGSPYLIQDALAYAEYYAMTRRAILEAFPQAKVGGPAVASLVTDPLPGFVRLCEQRGVPLDFLSWHLYHSDPALHAYQVRVAHLLTRHLSHRPELMVTEWASYPAAWNQEASAVSTEEQAFDPRRAAMVAAAVLEMRNAGLAGSFYYHLWDQVCYAEDFGPFFSPAGIANMLHHWNEMPHRLGLFGVDGEIRPQYFVYQMLAHLGETQVAATSEHADVRVLAGQGAEGLAVMLVNHGLDHPEQRVASCYFTGLEAGAKRLTIYRIDHRQRWDAKRLELLPVERRVTYTQDSYLCQVTLPADSVALVTMESMDCVEHEDH